MKKIMFFVFVLSILSLASCTKEKPFTIGFIPSENALEITPKAEELAKFLEKEMGYNVEIFVPTSYEALIEGLRFGHLDAAYMDSGPAWQAYNLAKAEVVLAEIKEGNAFYYGEIFARKDSNISSLEDMIGKRIAFTSFTGSSGFVYPIGTLIKESLIKVDGNDFTALEKSLQENFESYIVAGGYEQSLKLLLENKADIAGGAHDALEKYLKPDEAAQLKSVIRLGKVPSHPIVIGNNVPSDVREKFVLAMLKLNQEENKHILKNLYGVDGLIETNTIEHLGEFGPAFDALNGMNKNAPK